MKKKRVKSPILLQNYWEIIPRTHVRFDFPQIHQKEEQAKPVFSFLADEGFNPFSSQAQAIVFRSVYDERETLPLCVSKCRSSAPSGKANFRRSPLYLYASAGSMHLRSTKRVLDERLLL